MIILRIKMKKGKKIGNEICKKKERKNSKTKVKLSFTNK